MGIHIYRAMLCIFCGVLINSYASAQTAKTTPPRKYDIAAFLYPAYVADDPRLRPFWPKGIGEWETVTSVQDRFPGFYWDRKPTWGTINEADPSVMAMEINEATKHGVNVFIFDWYWYDGRPFMETTLNNGFLKADNKDKMKFYLMWANHDVVNTWDVRLNKYNEDNVIWQGKVSRDEFEKICKRNIEKYFKQPNYYKIDGKPVFMIYDIPQLISGLGGIEQTAAALKWFKEETIRAGFPGLDLQLTMWGINLNYSGFDGSKTEKPQNAFVKKLGFTSATHYQFAHFTNVNEDYLKIMESVKKEWDNIDKNFELKYYPHVSVGWDNSPRTGRSAVVKNNTPANFAKALRDAKAFADAHPKQVPLITINSWNEWTETSYLQPDNVYGYGYLKAIKEIFVDQK
ncbi:glycosyltransferase WbsX family protein [Mucilaginibacter myungsuensis]|uniref:Glycoside hydrolase family 99-like domain-containing protein n=1 Tax=Mucilaginibacter myungsuensis TaxID=649104 RepID=A0A929L3D5_9SPHI|nr:glycoside hydrolase family 99-like domain-containing protein [Mucilaginibacter myungsuensis]MBE9663315.1 glycoside hydrolase family 99-like domain-containing protein [Mucilaginibacter myungsuensis]MDN3600050.1 glycoside hydrolase family 99-like domain-containing protein [Mucilaginibacter myungsuensis]